jgi:hypothetical protein
VYRECADHTYSGCDSGCAAFSFSDLSARAWPDLGRERKGKASPVARTRKKQKKREVWVPMVLMALVPPAVLGSGA